MNTKPCNHYIIRLLIAGLVWIFAFQIFVSPCNASSHGEKNDLDNKQLIIWSGFEERETETLRGIARRFQAEKGIKVWIIDVPFYEIREKFIEEHKLGKTPDIISCPNDWIGGLSEKAVVEPFGEDELESFELDKFNPAGLEALKYKGKLYGLPFFIETVGIIYNKQLVTKEPAAMKELLEMADKIHNPQQGVFGFLYDVDNLFMSWCFLNGFGVESFQDAEDNFNIRKPLLDNDSAVEALKFMSSFCGDGKLIEKTMLPADIEELFINGQTAFTLDGPWLLPKLRRSVIEYGIMDFPPLENGNIPRPFTAVHTFLISSQCSRRESAVEFLNFLNSPENQHSFCSIGGRIPGRKDSLEALENSSEITIFAKIAKNGIPMPNHPYQGLIWQPIKQIFRKVLFNGNDPKTELENKVKEMEESMERLSQREK